jgi:hypothetical protein
MRYNDIIAPLVKAVQEQQEEIEFLQIENQKLKSQVDKLIDITNALDNQVSATRN